MTLSYYFIIFFIFFGSIFSLTSAAHIHAPKKPNIIVIMTDDHGQWALGAYNKHIKTPNLDYLASQGVIFNNAMTPAPVCSAAWAG